MKKRSWWICKYIYFYSGNPSGPGFIAITLANAHFVFLLYNENTWNTLKMGLPRTWKYIHFAFWNPFGSSYRIAYMLVYRLSPLVLFCYDTTMRSDRNHISHITRAPGPWLAFFLYFSNSDICNVMWVVDLCHLINGPRCIADHNRISTRSLLIPPAYLRRLWFST